MIRFVVGMMSLVVAICNCHAADGVFVRFRLTEPAGVNYYIKLGGYVHQPNWYLPPAVIPADAEKDSQARVAAGEYTEWFDLGMHAGAMLHGRLNLAGGIAEFPNVTAQFVTGLDDPQLEVDV